MADAWDEFADAPAAGGDFSQFKDAAPADDPFRQFPDASPHASATPARALAYGPIVGEHTHSTLFGPLGALGERDVAISPNLLKSNGGQYELGQSVDAHDKAGNYIGRYRVADTSYFSPGKPTSDTIEFRDRDISNEHVTIQPADGPPLEPQEVTQPDAQEVSPENVTVPPPVDISPPFDPMRAISPDPETYGDLASFKAKLPSGPIIPADAVKELVLKSPAIKLARFAANMTNDPAKTNAVIDGTATAVGDTAAGLSTLENIALIAGLGLAGTPALVSKAISLGFSAQAATGVYQKIQQLNAGVTDLAEKSKLIVGAIIEGAIATAAGKHGLNELPKTVRETFTKEKGGETNEGQRRGENGDEQQQSLRRRGESRPEEGPRRAAGAGEENQGQRGSARGDRRAQQEIAASARLDRPSAGDSSARKSATGNAPSGNTRSAGDSTAESAAVLASEPPAAKPPGVTPEMLSRAKLPANVARPPRGKAPKAPKVEGGFGDAFEESPLVRFILDEEGAIMSKSTARRKGKEYWERAKNEYDNAPEFKDPRHNQIYASRKVGYIDKHGNQKTRSEGHGGVAPDEAASEAAKKGLLPEGATASDLFAALQRESDAAIRLNKQRKAEARNAAEDIGQAAQQEHAFKVAIATLDKGEFPVRASDLKVGDTVTVNGTDLKVTDVGDTITLEDGKTYGIQHVDNDSVFYGKVIAETAPKLRPGENQGDIFSASDEPQTPIVLHSPYEYGPDLRVTIAPHEGQWKATVTDHNGLVGEQVFPTRAEAMGEFQGGHPRSFGQAFTEAPAGGSQVAPAVVEPVKAESSSALSLVGKINRVAEDAGFLKPKAPAVGFIGGRELTSWGRDWVSRLKQIPTLVNQIRRLKDASGIKKRVVATYDAIDNLTAYLGRQARNNVRLNLPAQSDLADMAATFVRQAEGFEAEMKLKLKALLGHPLKVNGVPVDAVVDYALRNWDTLKRAAAAAKEKTDTVYDAQQAAGIDFAYREGYVRGVYVEDLKLRPLDALRSGRSGSTSHKLSKVFNDYAEAIAAGQVPRDLRLSVLTENAVRSGMRLVNGQIWTEGIGTMSMPDGSPAIVPMLEVAGRASDGTPKKFARPPRGYEAVQTSPGNVVAVHEDVAATVRKLTNHSDFPFWASLTASAVKHNMLAFDIYHGSRFGQMQMAFEGLLKPSYHKGLAVLEYSDGDLSAAVKAGEISQKEADWARTKRPIIEGGLRAGANINKISDALYREMAPLLPFAKSTSGWIFGKLSRGVMSQSYVYAFERNAKLHPDWSETKVHSYTAREINTYYRNMGNQGLFKSRTAQDAARFFGFAPQWFEGKVRSEGRGFGQLGKAALPYNEGGQWGWNPLRGGNVARGMGVGLVSYFAVNQIVNMLTRGYPTWQNPEHGHKLDAWIPDFMQGTGGFFLSPLSVFAEISHDVMKAAHRGTELADIPLDIAKAQLGPAYAVGRDLFGGVDFYGRPLHGFDRFSQAFADAAPVPIGFKNRGYAGAAQRNAFSFGGLRITPAGSKASNVYQLASDWMRKNNIRVDQGGHDPSEYQSLRRSLAEGSMEDAKAAYDALRKTKSRRQIAIAMAEWADRPFTGGRSRENQFRKTLTRDQLDIYNAAKRERETVLQQFRRLRK